VTPGAGLAAAALAAALAAGPRPAHLECPAGAEHRGAPPPDDGAEWCERRDLYGHAVREGPARAWYDDGGLWIEERYREGERDGPWLEHHRNGRKAREGTYSRGRKTGRWSVWYESGTCAEEASFREGTLDGPFRAWHENGAKRTEGRYCGGIQCGPWRTWDDAGRELGSVEFDEVHGP